MERYDEDISENPFFQAFSKYFESIFDKAAVEQWIVVIPRIGSLPNCSFTKQDFEHHVVVPTEDNPTVFTTWNGKEIHINNNVITTGKNFTELQTVHILFEELFYTDTLGRFRVLCIENLLEGTTGIIPGGGPAVIKLRCLKECTDLIFKEVGDQRILYNVDEIIDTWNSEHHTLEFESLQYIRDLASALYTNVLQVVLKDPTLKKKVWSDKYLLEGIKLAVETYTMHGVYKRVMKGVTAYLAREDAHLNKTIRNLSDLQMRDLEIRPDFISSVPRAKQELFRLDWFTTPLDKVACVKRCLRVITQTQSCNSQSAGDKGEISVPYFGVTST